MTAGEAARLAGADPSKAPALITAPGNRASAIIVGEIGESEPGRRDHRGRQVRRAAQLKGKWEAHAVKQIANPLPGIDSALVIAGSDARGTIYGSTRCRSRSASRPGYWYSDVPVERRATITLDGAVRVDTGPDVKYRGIFINDEERTIEWAKLKFPTTKGTPDVNYYRHVYELMLRLKLRHDLARDARGHHLVQRRPPTPVCTTPARRSTPRRPPPTALSPRPRTRS